MKRYRGFTIKVPVGYRVSLGHKLHDVVNQMISSGMPAAISENKHLFSTKFYVRYLPQTQSHFLAARDFEDQIISLVEDMNGKAWT